MGKYPTIFNGLANIGNSSHETILHYIVVDNSLKHLLNLDVLRINLELIERHWEDMVRVTASLKMGWVTTSLLIGKYQSAQRQSELVKAFQEYGRLIKSISILRYVTNEAHRREIGIQLNKGEAMNNLRQFILFAREGKIYKRTLEDQQHQAKCMNWVTNSIVLWLPFGFCKYMNVAKGIEIHWLRNI